MRIRGCVILAAAASIILSCGTVPKGAVSDHFDGKTFRNPTGEPDHSFGDIVKWFWEMETVDWPEWIENEAQPLPELVAPGRIKAT